MTVTVGRVAFTAVLDGKGTPRDAENIGRKAGQAAGEGYDKEWSKTFRDTLSESGKKSFDTWQKQGSKDGGVYGDMFNSRMSAFVTKATKTFEGIRLDRGFLDNFARGFDDAGLAAGELQIQLRALEGVINGNALNAAKRQVDDWAAAQYESAAASERAAGAERDRIAGLSSLAAEIEKNRRAQESLLRIQTEIGRTVDATDFGRQASLLDRASDAMRKHASATGGASIQWSDLSHNTKQWTLIISAVLASMEELSVLGSAAGAGLVALGGAATAGIAGIGGIAAVMVTLNKDLEDLPASMQDVKREFDDFKGVFGEVRQAIASSAFRELDGVFTQLRANVSELLPAFSGLGTSVGSVFADLARSTKPGSDAIKDITRAIELAGPNFESLAGSAGTLGGALIRSFNGAQPLVEDLTGWIGRLAEQFDAFTRGPGLDEWVGNAQTTFGSLGPLLDSVGRALNNLVTPDSVNRTAAFLDNLTSFMPNFTLFLQGLGNLNVFGLLSQALTEIGTALEPLGPAFLTLTDALGGALAAAVSGIAGSVSILAQVAAPAANALALLVDSIPAPVVEAAAVAVGMLAGAILLIKVGSGVSAAFSAVSLLSQKLLDTASSSAIAGGALGKLGGAVAGVAAIGLLAKVLTDVTDAGAKAAPSIDAVARALKNGDLDKAFSNATSGADTMSKSLLNAKDATSPLGVALQSTITDVSDLGGALELLKGSSIDSWVENVGAAIGGVFGIDGVVTEARDGMAALDGAMAQLVEGGQAEAAAGQFALLAAQAEAQGISLEKLNSLFPGYNEALEASTASSATAAEGMQGINDTSVITGAAIDDLASKIRGFGSEALSTRDAAREFEASLDAVTGALAENGTTLDITTAAGRANETALDDVATATYDLAAATLKQTGDQRAANSVIQSGRDRLIEMLGQFGITGAAAEAYADNLGLIPKNVNTDVVLNSANARSQLNQFIRDMSGRVIQVGISAGVSGRTGNGLYATGGPVIGPGTGTSDSIPAQLSNGEHVWTAAEVTRAGGQDAMTQMRAFFSSGGTSGSMPWMDAVTRSGNSQKAPASFGAVPEGAKGATIEAGAIVIQGATDPYATANEVMYQVAQRVGG